MGSMNFGLYEMMPRYKEWKHDWELPYLAGSDERIFKNTFKDIAYILESCSAQRHALRDRVLRHRAPLHRGALPRPRAGQAAAVHPVGVRHARRHRPAPGGRDAHEAHRGPPVRRRLPVVGARRRSQPDGRRDAVRRHGRQRARRPRGQPVDRQGPARHEQRRAGRPGSAASWKSSAWKSRRRTRRGRC